MAEEVATGGLMKFKYNGGEKISKLNPEDKRAVKYAYEKHYEKKRKARRRKLMLIIFIHSDKFKS